VVLVYTLYKSIQGQIADLSDPTVANELIYINWGVGGVMILFGVVMTAVLYRRPIPEQVEEEAAAAS
jgi:hypothetical protein